MSVTHMQQSSHTRLTQGRGTMLSYRGKKTMLKKAAGRVQKRYPASVVTAIVQVFLQRSRQAPGQVAEYHCRLPVKAEQMAAATGIHEWLHQSGSHILAWLVATRPYLHLLWLLCRLASADKR